MDNQSTQPTNTTPPQTPVTQPAQPQPVQQPVSVASLPIERKGLKTAGGIVTLIFGVLTLLTGLLQAFTAPLLGIIVIGLGIFWLVTGILVLTSSEPEKTAKQLQRAGASAVAYTGILFFGGFFLPLFKLSAVLLPLVFSIAIAVISTRYAKK